MLGCFFFFIKSMKIGQRKDHKTLKDEYGMRVSLRGHKCQHPEIALMTQPFFSGKPTMEA